MTSENFIATEFVRLADALPPDTRWRVTMSSYVAVPDPRRGPGKMQYPTKLLRRADYSDLNPISDGAGRDGLTLRQVIERVQELCRAQADARQGRIILTPHSPGHHLSHIDDCSPDALQKMIADGFTPCTVIQTSPGKANVLLSAPRVDHCTDYSGHQAGKAVSQALNLKYGDPGARNEIQPFRCPGFANMKPKYKRADGTYPMIVLRHAVRQDCPAFARLLSEQPIQVESAHEAAARRVVQEINTATFWDDASVIARLKKEPRVRAYAAHAAAIRRDAEAGKLAIKREASGVLNQWSVDGMAARRMRQTGWSIEDVTVAVAVGTNLVRAHYKIDEIRTARAYSTKITDHAFSLDMSRFSDERWRIQDELASGVTPPILAKRWTEAGHTAPVISTIPPGRRAAGATISSEAEDAKVSVLSRNGVGRKVK
jgi:hypothetical protein